MRLISPLKSDIRFQSSQTLLLNSVVHSSNFPPPPSLSPTHLNSLLNTSTQTKDIKNGTKTHAQIIKTGSVSLPFLYNGLINMYAKCGLTKESILVFTKTDEHNIVSWTSLICGFAQNSKPFVALNLFSQMRRKGVCPNHFTFSAILPACSDTEIIHHGRQLHSLICKSGFQFDVFVGSALIDMYAKSSHMDGASQVFDEMPERNLVSWNTIIVGFTQNKLYEEAFGIFCRLLMEKQMKLDQVSFSSVLSACASTGSLSLGKQIHVLITKHGLKSIPYVKNSLIDMYSKCGSLGDAVKLFKTLKDRDVVTWNVMIMGWVQTDNFEEACNCFGIMRREGIPPDEASFSTALHASASLAALDQGTVIHNQIIKSGFVSNSCVASSLITMYAKCGSLIDAYQVFDEIKDRNVVCWTSMIAACQQHGHGDRVIEMFEEMIAGGTKPDYITFVCVLSACSHNGLIEKGFGYFHSMLQVHGLRPGSEHYACMVDLLGRAGRLEEAKFFIETMPVEPDCSIWGALLGACRNYQNLEMGREVAEKLFKMEPMNSGNYVLLANIYTQKGMLKEAKEVRRLMGLNGVKKETGCSWIEIKNVNYVFTVHDETGCSWIEIKNVNYVFTVHDKSHPKTVAIYEMLERLVELIKQKGYVAETQFAVNDIGEYKEQSLWYHSEKLALAFGLISTPAAAPIRIKKNLRTCGDCHTVMKLVSEIFSREIIVRDINRFHRFTSGLCSCRDFW